MSSSFARLELAFCRPLGVPLRYTSAMPWVKAKLRGTQVFARASATGGLGEGAVEIRYKLGDARAYRAQARNLEIVGGEVLGDESFPEAEFAEPKAKAGASSASSKTARKSAAKETAETRIMPADAFVAFTDGACSGNPGPAGSGVLLMAPGGASPREGYAYLGIGTNNVAELTAILMAAEAVPDDVPLVIQTDSQYAIGVLAKGWKAKANQELIARIKATLARREPAATLLYVPGHAGVAGNERADELAREAISRRQSRALG